ncbi:MAG: Gfo/Idh/MocA family oxidoreductase [Proteobacteria bacterium]|nr:Gfo/Idh/MocA family oxidoreductase [Pseudomonadota bacterium]
MSFGVMIVGLGQIGMGYDLHLDPTGHIYSHARAFSQHPSFHLVAGVDPEAQRRQNFEQKYQCSAYMDIDAALGHHQPDLVVIAVPTDLHGETLQRVLGQSHPKAILCEKPLSYDLQEARDMVQTCAARGVNLYVNYMRRSDPGGIEIKRRIDSGEIVAPVKGVAWYSKGFLHNGSHFFNLLEYWLGFMVCAEVLDPGRLWDGIDPEPDVRVTFKKGVIVFLAAWEEAYSHYTVEMLASNGRLRYEQGGEIIHWQTAQPDQNFADYTVLSAQPQNIASGMDRYQWHVAEQLAAALGGRNSHLCSGAQALATSEAMQTIIGMR